MNAFCNFEVPVYMYIIYVHKQCVYIYIHTCVKYIHIYPVCVYKQFNQPLNVSIGKGSEETVFVFEAFAIIVGETEPTDGTQW